MQLWLFPRNTLGRISEVRRKPRPMNSEHLLLSLIDDVQRRRESDGLDALTKTEQAVALVWELEAEVNNGGFSQYFFNRGGGHAVATIAALDAIGAHVTSQILRSAVRLFGQDGPCFDRVSRQRQLEALPGGGDEDFMRMDVAFYDYQDDLSNLLAEHVRKNAT